MNRLRLTAGILALLCTAGTARAQHQHDHASSGGTDQVGSVAFANSCAPAVQAELQRGVAMLHSFWYTVGEQTFRQVLAKDPGCAIAGWGIASLLMNNPLNGVGATPAAAAQAQAAIDAARRTGAGTQRERDYIEAVAAYYQDFANRPERQRQAARAEAYTALAARYPEDDEAQIFSALYIAGTQSQADQSYAAYARSAAILDPMFAKYPQHPGVAHYLIHVYDAPPLAAQGLDAAQRYASIAPDAPHAQHMPSHIFTRVGAWEESAATNRRSFASALRGEERPEVYHASDYAVYAELQQARDAAARGMLEDAFKVSVPRPMHPTISYAAAAMPARLAVERGDWRAAAQLPLEEGGTAYADAITLFARALGAARSGDPAAASREAAALEARHAALVAAGNAYWAREVAVQQRAAAGWIAFAEGRQPEAVALMREAADLEDRNEKHIVTPGRILPARELLGDMLLAVGQPAMALQEYQASQQREPNRFRGVYGAAKAAEAAGDAARAKEYYGRLVTLAARADSERPELAEARRFAAR